MSTNPINGSFSGDNWLLNLDNIISELDTAVPSSAKPPVGDNFLLALDNVISELGGTVTNPGQSPSGANATSGSSVPKPPRGPRRTGPRKVRKEKSAVRQWREGLKQKWPHLTNEEINTANPKTTYRSSEAVRATVRVPRNVEISRNTPADTPISRIGKQTYFDRANVTAPSVRMENTKRRPLKLADEVVADTVQFTPITKKSEIQPTKAPYTRELRRLPSQYDRYHPKSTFTPSNVDLNSRRTLDPNGSHISKQQIDADVAQQINEYTENRRKNLPLVKSLFAKKYDPRADELTAAYSGFKTNLFDKPVLDAEGNSVVRPQETIFPPNKTAPVLDLQGNPIVTRSGKTITTTTGRRFDEVTGNLHGAKTPWLDQRTSPITGLEGIQEDVLKSQLPEQLRGVSNLGNERDLFKFRAAYDQDLINNRLGKKANYANLTDNDIFQPHVRGVDLNNGEMFKKRKCRRRLWVGRT